MNAVLLACLDLFRWLFRLLRVDYAQLRAIVQIKLTMDNRRQVMSYKNRKATDETNNTFLWTVFFYSLFGLFVALAISGVNSLMVACIMFFSYLMVMIVMTLITDFSSILLDTSDNTIILPRPVEGRTLFAARIVHIMLYLGLITVGLSAGPALAMLIKYNFSLFIFFIAGTLLAAITAVAFTNALYLFVMQFASEEKLKNVINYFQIVMAVFIMAGYQLLPRLMGHFELDDYVFEIEWWVYFTPPAWIAGMLEAWHHQVFDAPHLVLTLCALVLPFLSLYLINKYLAPAFTRKLSAMASTTDTTTAPKNTAQAKTTLAAKLGAWLTNNTLERAAFEFIYTTIARDRKIKLKIYPSFGYMIVFGIIFLFRDGADIFTTLQDLPNTQYYLVLIYLTFIILQVAFYEIPYSDDFKASWVYFSSPLEKPGEILSGTLKAIFTRLFVPGYLIITALVSGVWGWMVMDDLLFGFFNNFLMLLTIALINKRTLPLSMEPSVRGQAGSLARSMLMMLMLAALGLGHFFLTRFDWAVLMCIPLQVITIYGLLAVYKKATWERFTL